MLSCRKYGNWSFWLLEIVLELYQIKFICRKCSDLSFWLLEIVLELNQIMLICSKWLNAKPQYLKAICTNWNFCTSVLKKKKCFIQGLILVALHVNINSNATILNKLVVTKYDKNLEWNPLSYLGIFQRKSAHSCDFATKSHQIFKFFWVC